MAFALTFEAQSPVIDDDLTVVVEATRPRGPGGRAPLESDWRRIGAASVASAQGGLDIEGWYEAVFGAPRIGQVFYLRGSVFENLTGQRSAPFVLRVPVE